MSRLSNKKQRQLKKQIDKIVNEKIIKRPPIKRSLKCR